MAVGYYSSSEWFFAAEVTGLHTLLIVPRWRRNETFLALACIGVFLSLWIEKGLGLVITGFVPSPLETITDYTPTGPELAITLGVWALGLLMITLLYKIFISIRKGE